MNLSAQTLIKLIVLFAILTITFSSCEKDEEPNPTQEETYTTLNQFFELKSPSPEIFNIIAENGASFTTNKGTNVTVPANAFINSSGQIVIGAVDIKLKEVFSNADMVFSGIFPISNGFALNSGGEFFIQASQDGDNLSIKDGVFIEIEIPAQAIDNNMALFFAGPIEEPDFLNWVEANDILEEPDSQNDITSNSSFTFNSVDNSYEISLDFLGWGNIDAFDYTVSYFDCVFNLIGIEGLDDSNTTAFAIFKDNNTVWPVGTNSWGTITNNIINETHLANVPLNLLIISVINNQLYYGLLDVTPQQGDTYSIIMNETTAANLDLIIESLP